MMHENSSHSGDVDALAAFEAAFDWWREAGVDLDYSADARNWLADEPPQEDATAHRPAVATAEPAQTRLHRAFQQAPPSGGMGGDRAGWPGDLGLFRQWWLSEPTLSPSGADGRLPPRGVAGAKLMVMVAEPYPDDGEALLSGGAGNFAAAILRAMRIAPHEAYLASALPAPLALADWPDLAAAGLGAVTAHHIGLVAPGRMLVFGRGLAPLFDLAPDEAREPAALTIGGGQIPLLLAPDLAELSRSPERRRNFWNRWLEWTA